MVSCQVMWCLYCQLWANLPNRYCDFTIDLETQTSSDLLKTFPRNSKMLGMGRKPV